MKDITYIHKYNANGDFEGIVLVQGDNHIHVSLEGQWEKVKHNIDTMRDRMRKQVIDDLDRSSNYTK